MTRSNTAAWSITAAALPPYPDYASGVARSVQDKMIPFMAQHLAFAGAGRGK